MAFPSRWFWIVAGINGAGKTTLTRKGDFGQIVDDLQVLNPDEWTEKILAVEPLVGRDEANRRAANKVESLVREALQQGQGFVVETVLSSDKYKPIVEGASGYGFRVGLIYICLSSVDLAILRVRDRVAIGGHDVPEDKLRSRWERSLDNLVWFATRVDRLLVYCNDDPTGNPVLIADGTKGNVRILVPDAVPEVTRRLGQLGRL